LTRAGGGEDACHLEPAAELVAGEAVPPSEPERGKEVQQREEELQRKHGRLRDEMRMRRRGRNGRCDPGWQDALERDDQHGTHNRQRQHAAVDHERPAGAAAEAAPR